MARIQGEAPKVSDVSLLKLIDEQEVPIKDAKAMMIKKIGKDMDDEVKIVAGKNNNLVEDFWSRLMMPLNKHRDVIRASLIWPAWLIFLDGINTKRLMTSKHLWPRVSDTLFKEYKILLTRDISSLYELGVAMVSFIHASAQNERAFRLCEIKTEMIYSSDDPLVWYERDASCKEKIKAMDNDIWSVTDRMEASSKVNKLAMMRVTCEN